MPQNPSPTVTAWASAIAEIVRSGLRSGAVDADALRTIVVAPLNDGLSMGVWLSPEWSNYPYIDGDESAVGAFPLAPWLKEVDAIEEGTARPATFARNRAARFADPALDATFATLWNGLVDDVRHAAALAATTHLAQLGTGGRIVGIFVGMDKEAEARLVALCHPHGNGLLPAMVNRQERTSLTYPQVALVDDGFLLFFCKDEGNGLAIGGTGNIKRWTFAAIESARVDRNERDLLLRFSGDVFDVAMSPGHTDEEHGGPGREDVIAALVAHVTAYANRVAQTRPGFLVDPSHVAAPGDGPQLRALVDRFVRCRGDVLGTILERHAAVVARVLPTADLDAKLRAQVVDKIARPLALAGDVTTALALLDSVEDPKTSHGGVRKDALTRAYCLLALGRPGEVVGITGHYTEPFVAIALSRLNRRAEADALLKKAEDDDEEYARAILAAEAAALEDAAACAVRAFSFGTPHPLLRALGAAHPVLRGVDDAQRAARGARDAAGQAAQGAPVVDLALKSAPRLRAAAAPGGVFLRAASAARGDTDSDEGAEGGDDDGSADGNTSPRDLFASATATEGVTYGGTDAGELVNLGTAARQKLFDRGLRALVQVGADLVASDERALVRIGADGAVQWRAQPHSRGDGFVCVSPRVIAHRVGDSIELVDATTGTLLSTWHHGERHYITHACFVSDSVLLCASDVWLYFVDVSNPAEPHTRARTRAHVTGLSVCGGLLLLRTDDELVVLALSDPYTPQPLVRFRLDEMPRAAVQADHLWLAARRAMWSLSLVREPSGARAPARDSALTRFGLLVPDADDGSTLDTVDNVLALRMDGETLELVGREHGLLRVPLSRFSQAALRAEAATQQPLLVEALRAAIGKAQSDGVAVGVVRVRWLGDAAAIDVAGPTSIIEAAGYLAAAREDHVQLRPPRLGSSDDDDAAELTQLHDEAIRAACDDVVRAALLEVLPSCVGPSFAQSVLLCSSGRGTTVVAVAHNPAGAPLPARAVTTHERTLRERLSSSRWYEERTALTQRARTDGAFRAELYALLVPGEPSDADGPRRSHVDAAVRITLDVLDTDRAAATEAVLRAAPVDARPLLPLLLRLRTDLRTHAFITRFADDDDVAYALASREALGRLDDADTLERICALLRTAPLDDELPLARLLKLNGASLAHIKSDLVARFTRHREHEAAARARGAYAGDDSKNLIPLLACAGVADLPDDVWKPLAAERESEGDTLMAGILDDTESELLVARRALTVRALAAALDHPDHGAPLFVGTAVESSGRGRQRLAERLWPALSPAARTALRERLLARTGDTVHAAFALTLLHVLLVAGDAAALPFAESLRAAEMEPAVVAKTRALARQARVQHGWALSKAGKLTEARVVADAALADEPDGQALFFDARLVWLETNDPAAAIPRIEAALARSTDDAGLARLYNLRGAVCDALGQYDASIVWFERALAAHPADAAMLLSNIAEAHDKCGRAVEARAFAERAAARGSTTDVVKKLLAIA